MFNDAEWLPGRNERQRARLDAWLRNVDRPIVVELGAGVVIPSARNFSRAVLRDYGGRLIRINPREARVPTSLDVGLSMGALAGLVAIQQALAA